MSNKSTCVIVVCPLIVQDQIFRVGQGFWVYGIQGLFKSGIRYIAA